MAWDVDRGAGAVAIKVPGGTYAPKTDDLTQEILAAAKKAGLENFNVKIGNKYYDDPADLKTNSIAKLAGVAIIVEPYDIAG